MDYLNLDRKKTEKTINQLNILLADYHLYYQKLRNFHWNVRGKNFFELHEKFEDLYNEARLKVDELAERILTLRHRPVSNMSEYLKISNLKESPSDISDSEMIGRLLQDHAVMLGQMRTVITVANEGNDEGTADLIGAYIREMEKTSWMLDAWRVRSPEVMEVNLS